MKQPTRNIRFDLLLFTAATAAWVLLFPGTACAQVARVLVRYIPGQESRVSENFTLNQGDGSELEWRVEVPELYKQRVAFALNRDRKRNSDLNLADHLADKSLTSGGYGEYGERVYIARLKYVDEKGVHHGLSYDLVEKHPEIAVVLKNGFYVSAHRTIPQNCLTSSFGGNGGSPEELILPEGWIWRSFEVRAGSRIDAVTAKYEGGGQEHSVRFGGSGGSEQVPFVLRDGEFIVKIRGRSGSRLDAIQFVTNTGRESPSYGGSGGRPFEWAAPAGWQIVGFRTRTGSEVDRISPVARPVKQ